MKIMLRVKVLYVKKEEEEEERRMRRRRTRRQRIRRRRRRRRRSSSATLKQNACFSTLLYQSDSKCELNYLLSLKK